MAEASPEGHETPRDANAGGRSEYQTVLRTGNALAVLQTGVAADQLSHTRAASEALSRASGRPDIVVQRRASGRPGLAPPYAELGVSLSFRAGMMLAGFSPDRAVGVDLEPDDVAAVPDPVLLARDHYAAAEAISVAALPERQSRDLFLRLWVAKEAALKVTGRGVADGLALPDLSGMIERLCKEGTVVEADLSPGGNGHPESPRVEIAVRRLQVAGGGAVYCALAVAARG